METTWPVRRASPRDADRIADLCRRAVGPDDYVLDYLPRAILRGVLNVVEDRGHLVGMMLYVDTIDGGGWLAMARTDPGYRRRGIARALIESLSGMARNKGRTSLRLWTEGSNDAGIAAVRAAGWVERGRFTRMKVAAKGAPKVDVVPFSERLWTRVEKSTLVRASHGFLPYEWVFLRCDRPTLYQLCNRRAIVRTADGTYVRHVDPENPDREALDVGLLLGSPKRAVGGAAGLANASGLPEAHAFLPFTPQIVRAAKNAGWKAETWGREAVLFEKVLGAAPIAPRRRRTYAEIAAQRSTGFRAPARASPGDFRHGGPSH